MRDYKEAVDDYRGSEEWLASSDPATLMAPSRMRQYLENRLKRAFDAGWNSREDLAQEQTKEKASAYDTARAKAQALMLSDDEYARDRIPDLNGESL